MMKKSILLFALLGILSVSCTPTDKTSNDDPNSIGKTPKLIVETNGWHVHSGQRVPLSVGETAVQLQIENGHFSQSYQGMFYMDPNTTTFDYARANVQGDSIYIRNVNTLEYAPFFYKEGDVSDVRYGTYYVQSGAYSSHAATGLNGIGPSSLDTNTQIHTFTSNVTRSYKFSNPNLYMYYDGNTGGIKAYRIGTNQVIDLSSNTSTSFSAITFKGTLDIDETYCKANPTHIKAYYASNNNGISYNGHSPNYINIYSVDDVNKMVFRDSTSAYRVQASGIDSKVSCNDANNVYFFFSSYTNANNVSGTDKNILLLVYNKTTQKITQKQLLSQFSDVKEAFVIPSKNQIFLNSTSGLFKMDLSNNAITNVTPQWLLDNGNLIPPLAIATDGNKLYAIIGSAFGKYSPAVTNLIYYE